MQKFNSVFGNIQISQNIMEQFKNTYVQKVSISKSSNILKIELLSNQPLKGESTLLLKSEFLRHFNEANGVEVKIQYDLPEKDDANSLIKACKGNICTIIGSKMPITGSILEKAGWSVKEEKLLISLEAKNSYFLIQNGVHKHIERILRDSFGVSFNVDFLDGVSECPVYSAPQTVNNVIFETKKSNNVNTEKAKKAGGSFFGKQIKGEKSSILNAKTPGDIVLIEGEILTYEKKEIKNEKLLIKFDITDYTDSTTVLFFIKRDKFAEMENFFVIGNRLKVEGEVIYDKYSNEVNIMAKKMDRLDSLPQRMDNATEKRIEFHLHTQMSQMDGMTATKALIACAARWGHSAVAITDHGVVQAFPEAMDAAKKHGIKVIYGMEGYLIDDIDTNKTNLNKLKSHHIIILAKNLKGIKNLYKLVTKSSIEYFHKRPRIPKSILDAHRDGLILGSACESGELYRAVLNEEKEKRQKEIAEFYDYLEIQPLGNNQFLLDNGRLASKDALININKRIIELGEELNKPVLATCDVHFLNPEDEVFRRIIMKGDGYKDADKQPPLYFRTTEEMLKEFYYLPDEKAKEVVIYNTQLISDMIEEIVPIPEGTYPPEIDGSEETLRKMVMDTAVSIYGETLPVVVKERLDKELNSIITNGFSVMYIIAQKLVKNSLKNNYLVGSRGSVGSSFAATMAGITEVNPLSPHYICENCKYSDFESEVVVSFAGGSGCDMPDKDCPNCGKRLKKDGHDIPFETFLGFGGDKEPDIDLNFSGEYQQYAHLYAEELFGSNNVFKAGTIGTLADKTAYGYVKKYFDEKKVVMHNAEINRLVKGCTGIKKTTGQHPGGLMIVPQNKDIHNFTPVQRPANDMKSTITTTHFDYHSIAGKLLKLDLLGHDDPTVIRMLFDLTGVNPQFVPLDDEKTMSLFTTPKELNVTAADIECETGTLGLPEFGTKFVRQMLLDTKPKTFAELIRIAGLSHGTDVWLNNAQDYVKSGIASLKDIISTRDDIMVYLIIMGVPKHIAFQIMESVRKGKGVNDEQADIMRQNNVPKWYMESCNKIKYMFPKAHAAAYVMMAFRIAYFKVHYPVAFYTSYFSVRADDFDYTSMCGGEGIVISHIKELSERGKDITAKDKNKLTILEVVLEMYKRGIKFSPIDLYKSDAEKFIAKENSILPPFRSVPGLGSTAALSIQEARKDGEFLNIEDLRMRTSLSKTVIELLKETGILADMPETSQLTFI